MQLHSIQSFANERRLSLWLGASSLLFGVFLKLTSELLGNELQGLDSTLLTMIAAQRQPWLTGIAVDLTALGSVTVVALIALIAFCVLLLLRDWMGAWQLVLASIGAGLLTLVTKNFIERSRPDNIAHLVEASGFSYPSGHSLASASLYITVAILAAHHFPTIRSRAILLSLSLLVISLVAISRIYLGVHYPSDVISGVSSAARSSAQAPPNLFHDQASRLTITVKKLGVRSNQLSL